MFQGFGDEVRNFKSLFFFFSLLLSFHDCSSLILGDFVLHRLELFFRIAFNLFDFLVLSFDFVFVLGEGLSPAILEELDELVLLLLLLVAGRFLVAEVVASFGGERVDGAHGQQLLDAFANVHSQQC